MLFSIGDDVPTMWTYADGELTAPDAGLAARLDAENSSIVTFEEYSTQRFEWSFEKTGSFLKFGLQAKRKDDLVIDATDISEPSLNWHEMIIHQPGFTVNELVLDTVDATFSFTRTTKPQILDEFPTVNGKRGICRTVTVHPKPASAASGQCSAELAFIEDELLVGYTCIAGGTTVEYLQVEQPNYLGPAATAFISHALTMIDGRGATTIRI